MTAHHFAVFIDSHRHTCIRVAVGRRYTAFIAMEAEALRVQRLPHDSFSQRWQCYNDYPVQRAAWHYLKSIAAQFSITPEANAYLELIRNATTDEDFTAISTKIDQLKEQLTMTTETNTNATASTAKAAAKPAKATKAAAKPATKAPAKATAKAPAKATAKAPAKATAKATKPVAKAASKAPAKAAKGKPAAKPTKAAKPTAKGAAAAKPGRRSAMAGMSIQFVGKDALAGLRDGTYRKALMTHIAKGKKVDDVIGSALQFDGEERRVAAVDLQVAVNLGIIKVA